MARWQHPVAHRAKALVTPIALAACAWPGVNR